MDTLRSCWHGTKLQPSFSCSLC